MSEIPSKRCKTPNNQSMLKHIYCMKYKLRLLLCLGIQSVNLNMDIFNNFHTIKIQFTYHIYMHLSSQYLLDSRLFIHGTRFTDSFEHNSASSSTFTYFSPCWSEGSLSYAGMSRSATRDSNRIPRAGTR